MSLTFVPLDGSPQIQQRTNHHSGRRAGVWGIGGGPYLRTRRESPRVYSNLLRKCQLQLSYTTIVTLLFLIVDSGARLVLLRNTRTRRVGRGS